MKPTFALTLHGDEVIGGMPLDVTKRLAGWKHSIHRVGGFWQASAAYNLAEGDLYEMRDIFINGLGRRITAEVGGDVAWEGFLGEMDLTLEGQRWTRSLLDCANAVKIAYTRTSTNLFPNPSVETVAWPAESAPTTIERTTDWHSLGDYSMHCVTRATENDEGMQVGVNGDMDTITIDAEMAYQVKVSVKIESGTWVLKVKEQISGSDTTIAKAKSAGTGEQVLCANITEDNTYTSVRVILIEKTTGTSGEIYADNARFQFTPTKAETTWYTDSASIATYGRIEDIVMEEVLTGDQAGGRAQWHLARRAWPRTLPASRMSIAPGQRQANGLNLRFYGYVWTLNWQHIVTTGGEAQANTHITSLIGEGEFVTAGTITENTMTVMIDSTYPTRLWDKIKKIIAAGDDNGNEWEGGVYRDLEFHYEQTPTTVQYHFAGGRFLAANGEEMPPWKVRPGLTMLDDMPVGPGQITGNLADDPRIVLLEGVEYTYPDRVTIMPQEIGFQVR